MSYSLKSDSGRIKIFTDEENEALILIEGADRAALIDTGMDHDRLDEYVRTLTDKPVTAILTHGHIDHIGRSGDFETVLMSDADREIYRIHSGFVNGNGSAETAHLNILPEEKVQSIGDTVRLGSGDELKILPLPGHTAGSILIVDEKSHTVCTGDALGSGCGCWMQIDGCQKISVYRDAIANALQMLEALGVDDTWTFVGGHYGQEYQSRVSAYNKFDLQLVRDMKVLCDQLLQGEALCTPIEVMHIEGCEPFYACCGKAEMLTVKELVK